MVMVDKSMKAQHKFRLDFSAIKAGRYANYPECRSAATAGTPPCCLCFCHCISGGGAPSTGRTSIGMLSDSPPGPGAADAFAAVTYARSAVSTSTMKKPARNSFDTGNTPLVSGTPSSPARTRRACSGDASPSANTRSPLSCSSRFSAYEPCAPADHLSTTQKCLRPPESYATSACISSCSSLPAGLLVFRFAWPQRNEALHRNPNDGLDSSRVGAAAKVIS